MIDAKVVHLFELTLEELEELRHRPDLNPDTMKVVKAHIYMRIFGRTPLEAILIRDKDNG